MPEAKLKDRPKRTILIYVTSHTSYEQINYQRASIDLKSLCLATAQTLN